MGENSIQYSLHSLGEIRRLSGTPSLLEVAVVVGRSEALDGERGVDDDVRGRRSDALLELSIKFAFALVVLGLREILRSEVNIELNFPPKLRGARSRLYRRRFLQVNTRWKALAEIYTMHSFAPFSNLNFFVKNRQFFFAIELMNIH